MSSNRCSECGHIFYACEQKIKSINKEGYTDFICEECHEDLEKQSMDWMIDESEEEFFDHEDNNYWD